MKNVSMVKPVTFEDIGQKALFMCYPAGYEWINKQKKGKQLLIEYSTARNPKHHALIFALARCTIDNLPDNSVWSTKTGYEFIKALQLEIGDTDDMLNFQGELIQVPKSLKFESMSEDQFEKISDAMFLVCAKMLQIEVSELQLNYVNYL